jgi:hypothetical protein
MPMVTGKNRGSVSAMMQSLGRRYVRYVNGVYQRTGTLFEGRFKSSLIDGERCPDMRDEIEAMLKRLVKVVGLVGPGSHAKKVNLTPLTL